MVVATVDSRVEMRAGQRAEMMGPETADLRVIDLES